MSTKEIVADVLEYLPDEASVEEAIRRIEFVAAVHEGLESYEREGGISIEEVREQIASWARAATK